jgi:hypothetical protein
MVAPSPRHRADILVGGYFTRSFSTEGGTVSKTALRWYFGRWLLHAQFSTEGGKGGTVSKIAHIAERA